MAGLEAAGQDLLDPNQKKDASLTDFDYKVYGALSKIVGKGFLAKDFLGYMVDYLALNQPLVPIGQVVGFTAFTAQLATANSLTGVTSTTYVDNSPVGPTLTGLPDGKYVILYGATISNSGANATLMSYSANGAAASDGDSCSSDSGILVSVSIGRTVTLSAEGNNTVTCKFRVAAGTGAFARPWLIALKYANA